MLTIKELYPLVRAVKGDIADDYRAFDEEEEPGIQLTVGYTPKTYNGVEHDTDSWNFQTGDNSWTGDAYSHPIWGVVGVYRISNCREVAREIIDQIHEQME